MIHHGSVLSLVKLLAPLSLMSFGGGQAIITEIKRQSVSEHHWLTENQFLRDYVISRISPGPSSLVVLLIGYQVAGVGGALAATIAIFLPSSVLVYAIAHLWSRFRGAQWQLAVEAGLAPVAAGLILAASATLMQINHGGWTGVLVVAATTGAVLATRINPLVMIGAGALVFVARG